MLAMHKNVEEKLYTEVAGVIDKFGSELTEKHLHNLNYLDMVVKETLRLFPVLPIHARIATEDIKLEKYTIPAGANIVISVFNAQRKVANWGEDAEKFRPERFLPENYEKIHSYAFLPFSRGEVDQ
jgi:cytochrome P450 family 4